MLKNAMTKGNI